MHRRAGVVVVGVVVIAIGLLIVLWWPDSYALRPISDDSVRTAQRVAGCWQFERGAALLAEHVSPGSTIDLDNIAESAWTGKASPDVRRIRIAPLVSATARWSGGSGWGIDSADADLLHLWIGDGFTGFDFRLRLRDGALVGTARAYSDAGPDLSLKHRVRAIRVSCAARSL